MQIVDLMARLVAFGCISNQDTEAVWTRLEHNLRSAHAKPDMSSPELILWKIASRIWPVLVLQARTVVSPAACLKRVP